VVVDWWFPKVSNADRNVLIYYKADNYFYLYITRIIIYRSKKC
jgi:hypothetical protein